MYCLSLTVVIFLFLKLTISEIRPYLKSASFDQCQCSTSFYMPLVYLYICLLVSVFNCYIYTVEVNMVIDIAFIKLICYCFLFVYLGFCTYIVFHSFSAILGFNQQFDMIPLSFLSQHIGYTSLFFQWLPQIL